MEKNKTYLVYDGLYYLTDTPLFKSDNRAFRFGDGLFETIRYHKGRPLFFPEHYNRLIRGMAVLRLSVQGFPSRVELEERMVSLVNKNRFFGDVRIRVTVFRKGEGLYTPQNLQASWIIEASPLPFEGYPLNDKGLVIDFFSEFPKQVSPISPFKTVASMPYVMAGLFCKEHNIDDCLLQNGQGKYIESVSSNLFWIKDDTFYTPGIGSGCIEGIIRQKLMEILPQQGYKIVELPGTTASELQLADEIFLTNSINGIRWVVGLGETRYYGIKIRKIHKLLISMLD